MVFGKFGRAPRKPAHNRTSAVGRARAVMQIPPGQAPALRGTGFAAITCIMIETTTEQLVMAYPPRRTSSARDKAEAAFKAATTKPSPATPGDKPAATERRAVPAAREMVSLRIDREVLEHFQDEGPGWQERINQALRKAAGL